MSGHTPIRLFLIPARTAASEAGQKLLETLRRDFQADLRPGVNKTPEGRQSEWGRAVVGEREISIEVDFLPGASPRELVFPVILLHSEAYEAAFDLLQGHLLPRGKEALLEFCLKTAAAVDAEGFRLEFAGDERVRTLTIDQLVKDLTSQGPGGLVAGIAIGSPSLGVVKAVWPLASARNGYLILDFI